MFTLMRMVRLSMFLHLIHSEVESGVVVRISAGRGLDEKFATVSFLCAACISSRLPDCDGERGSAEVRNGGRRFRRRRAVCRFGSLDVPEVHRSIALYGIIHCMKEVLHRRCACRWAK